uniref:MPN domain-containing protein n=1 Tax=Heterorhabditis bacteriophora TaxID=37862 RepID=A0A1I7XFR0_HETBA
MTDVSMIADVGLNTSCTAVTGTGVRCIDATLHPLVIMNISEHWTRVKAQSKDRRQQKRWQNKCDQMAQLLIC